MNEFKFKQDKKRQNVNYTKKVNKDFFPIKKILVQDSRMERNIFVY